MDEQPSTARKNKRIDKGIDSFYEQTYGNRRSIQPGSYVFFFFGAYRFKVWEVKANEEMML
jgi:hypothetical protein